MVENNTRNRILLHMLKHNPKNGEVFITWEDETFVGNIQDIEIRAGVSQLTTFTISGIVGNVR